MRYHGEWLLSALLTFSALAAAHDDRQFLRQQLAAGDALRAAQPPDVVRTLPQSRAPNAGQQAWIDGLRSSAAQTRPEKPVPEALYFVSFSMPEAGLKTLVDETARLRIPATLRGLIHNNLRDTAGAVMRLVKDGSRAGVQIDPTAFRTYGITAVPTLVVTCGSHYDRIAGNIAPVQALRKIAEDGECSAVAQRLLKAAGEDQ